MTNSFGIEADLDQILKLQHELSRIMADAVDPMAGLAGALERVAAMPGVDGVWTWFRSADTGDFHLDECAGLCDALTLELDVFPSDTPVGRRLVASTEAVGTWQDIWPEKARLIHELGWKQVAMLPIISQGEVIGALGSGRKTSECIDERCLWVLRTLANVTGGLVASTRNETESRNTSANLAQMLDSFPDRMFIVAADGTVLYHNLAAVNSLADCRQKLVGEDFEQLLPGYGRIRLAVAGVERLADQPVPAIPLQAQLMDGDGGSLVVEVRIDQGSWDGCRADVVVCRDISVRLGIEQENLRLVRAINQVAEAIVITDAKGTITDVNPAFTRLTGYTRDEAIGSNPRLLKSEEHGDEFYREMWRTLNSGEDWSGRMTNRAKNGELFIEDATLSPIKNESGAITHYVAVKRDVTQEVELEERLREAQKMEAVGTLAGGLAHDFNNILYALLGYADLALDDVPPGHPARSSLEEITRAGGRAAQLVAKLLSFRQHSDGKREAVVVTDVVAAGMELVRAALPATVCIETDLTTERFLITADATELHQVLLNLCTNAQNAMRDDRGLLSVTVDRMELGAGAARIGRGLTPGSWVRIRVADTGCGIDPNVVDRIFEPYFTTRKSHEGTGLGLAMVRGIVNSHGGQVFVESEPGAGSEFTIYLPVLVAAAESQPTTADNVNVKRPVSGHGHIMVIDDEPMVVDVLHKALERLGYEVSTFGNGIEALEVFRAAPDNFDVVVTDQTMPNITGFELASEMLGIRPDLPLILTTGYNEKTSGEQALEMGIRYFMPKPLDMRELGTVLRELTASVPIS